MPDEPIASGPARHAPAGRKTTSTAVRVLSIGGVVVGVSIGSALFNLFGRDRLMELVSGPPTPMDVSQRIARCEFEHDLACAEKGWNKWLEMRPDDTRAMGELGLVLAREDKHAQAAAQLKRAIDGGETSPQLQAAYAESVRRSQGQ